MMLQTDRNKYFIHKDSSVQQSPNPYSPVQRTIPSCDIKTYITKAQNTTDAKVKFEILDEIIKEFPANAELANFFTELVAEIFGFGEYAGWRLNSLDGKSHSDDSLFKRVYNFLHPYGSIFKLIDKLENENAVFDIPSTLLQRYLAGASHSLTSLHQQRSGLVSGSQALSSPKLNALEYYLFMFFNYVSQPKSRKEQIDWNKYAEVVYVSLFEEYLAFFLPLDASPSTAPSNPLPSSGSSFFSWHGSSQRPMTLTPTSSFHAQTANIHSSHPFNIGMKTIISNNALGGMRRSTWKSETFVQILSDLWLTNNEQTTDTARTTNLQEYQLPSVDQTLLIRIFVKHMHHFLNCGRSAQDENASNYPNATAEGQKEEFKRAILPSTIQKKLYLFLKNCFSHWPLDPTFKMVLETWLSYIQPWRYSGQQNTENPNISSQTDITDWQCFIDDNLLFYTMLFRMFVARVARLDLQSLKDIQMIQRVTKVFSQQNFTDLVKEAENSMLASSNPSSLHRISSSRLTPPYNAFRSSHKGLELEDTGFRYESIFDQHYVHQMEEVAQRVFNEGESLRQENAQRKTKEVNKSMMGKIKAFFGSGLDDEEISQDSKLEELLDIICIQLAEIFSFTPPTSPKQTLGQFESVDGGQRPKPFISDKCYEDGRLLPEHVVEHDGSITLTEKGRQQIMQKLRHFDIKGAAAFDLEPVRSYEIHALVRWMYQLSARLNDKYKEPLTKIYNREDFVGKILRTFSPKVIEHDGKPVRLPSTSAIGVLQPKISLRFLASYYTIYYIGWLLLIAKLFGLGFIEFSLLSLLLLVVFILQNIVSCPVKKD